MPARLVLLGGGHAHLEVLRQLARRPLRDARVTLVSLFEHHHYSSVVPAYLQGRQSESEFTFDLRAICDTVGAAFIEGGAESIDPVQREVTIASDRGTVTVPYDVLSLDVGSVAAGDDIPGVRAHACALRPMTNAIALKARLDALIDTALQQRAVVLPIAVVGAGAAGIEVTLAIARRLADAGLAGTITLIDGGDAPLRDFALSAQRKVTALLERRAVTLRLGHAVRAIDATAVHLADGSRCEAVLTVWLTGAASPPIVCTAGLETDEGGFLMVGDTLRAVNDPHVWGAGDCVSFRHNPRVAKAGVYAVRAGPVLAHNLRAALEGGRLRRFIPQRQFLAILDTGDGRGLLLWHGLAWHSRPALMLKQAIDRRFVRRYQPHRV